MRRKYLLPLILILLTSSSLTLAQDPCLDSLKSSLRISDSLMESNLDSAYPLIKGNLALADSCGDEYHRAWAIESEGYYYYVKSQLPEAIDRFKEALSIYREVGDSADIFFCLAQLGDCYTNLGLSEKAIDYYLQVLPYQMAQKDTYNLAVTYLHIGLLHYEQEAYSKSQEYYQKTLDLVKGKDGYGIVEADAYTGLADIALEDENLVRADSLYLVAIDIFKSNDQDALGLSQSYAGVSQVHYELGDLDSALHYNEMSIEYANQIEDAFLIGSSHLAHADLLLEMDDVEGANESIEIAEEAIPKTSALHLTHELLRTKARVLARQGDHATAYELMVHADSLSDSLKSQNVEKILVQNRLEEEELQNLKAQQLNLKRKQEITLRNYVIGGALLLIVGLIILAWIVYVNHRKTKRLNQTKDYIISVIGHDLRTPVYQIKELLAMAKNNPDSMDTILTMARESSSNLVKNFDNLVHWAKTQLSGISVNDQTLDLQFCIEEEIDFFHISLQKKDLSVGQENIAGKCTRFDPTHLEIIIRNLLNNAIKFSHKHSKIIFRVVDQSDYWQLEIQDFGDGMTPATLKALRNDQPRKSLAGTDKETGTGMGISLVKRFLQANGASLFIESKEGEGSTFKVLLPKG